MKQIYLLVALLMLTHPAKSAEIVHLYGGENLDVYLGCLNCVSSDAQSIWNSFRTYGSEFSQTSVWNEFGDYGGEFSSTSPFNEFALYPPAILDEQGGFYGFLTVNSTISNRAVFGLTKFMYFFYEKTLMTSILIMIC